MWRNWIGYYLTTSNQPSENVIRIMHLNNNTGKICRLILSLCTLSILILTIV